MSIVTIKATATVTKETFQHGFDQGCAWAGRVARAALAAAQPEGK